MKMILGLSLFAALSGVGSAQSLIVNGTFEAPSPGVAPAGWGATGPAAVTAQTYSSYGNVGVPSGVGSQFAAFNSGNTVGTSTLTQTVALTAGTEYDLSFLYGNYNGSAVPTVQSLAFSVTSVVGSILDYGGTINASSPGSTLNFSSLLQQYSFLFTASVTGNYVVSFSVSTADTTTSDGILDNVFLTRAVPELNGAVGLPFALMAVLGCGLLSRRRRQSQGALL